jgi:hypothetical protein
MLVRTSMTAMTIAVLLVVGERPAYAYVDPGSASYLFQLIIGGLLVGMYFVRSFWIRLKDSIGARFTRPRE